MKMEFDRIVIKLAILLLVLLNPIKTSHAESYNRDYESNSGVGFYGEYIFPEDVDSPIELPIIENEGTIVQVSKGNQAFPRTGVKNTQLPLIGVSLIIGSYLLKKRKRELYYENY